MVEVAGIEPASENLPRKASTCLVGVLNLTGYNSHRQDVYQASPLKFRFGTANPCRN